MSTTRFTVFKRALFVALFISQVLYLLAIFLPSVSEFAADYKYRHTAVSKMHRLTPQEIRLRTGRTGLRVGFIFASVFNLIAVMGVLDECSFVVINMAVTYSMGSCVAIWYIVSYAVYLQQVYIICNCLFVILLTVVTITFAVLLGKGEGKKSDSLVLFKFLCFFS